MRLITDTREQVPLKFPQMSGVEVVVETLGVGDYSATYEIDGRVVESDTVIERKELGDLFNSYTSGYERERNKFLRAKEKNKKFILAVESSLSEILKGHSYTKGGKDYYSKKDGISMLRQLMTCSHKYGINTWFFNTRAEMALQIQEYFLAEERFLKKQAEENKNVSTNHEEGQRVS